eukprot:7377784-Prymnesium_polylepis.1
MGVTRRVTWGPHGHGGPHGGPHGGARGGPHGGHMGAKRETAAAAQGWGRSSHLLVGVTVDELPDLRRLVQPRQQLLERCAEGGLELVTRDRHRARRAALAADGGGARLVLEEGALAEELALGEGTDDHLAPVGVLGDEHLELALEDDVEGVALVALLEDH